MSSHNLELSLNIEHYDHNGKLKHTYLYPYIDKAENTVTFNVKDSNSKTISSNTYPVRSFVNNFLQVFSSTWASNSESFTTTSGGSSPVLDKLGILQINAGLNDDTFGIWVGSGSVTPYITSYQMINQIQDGSGSGQLLYKPVSFLPPGDISGGRRLIVKRDFTNNSGNTITITTSGVTVKTNDGTIYLSLIDTTDENSVSLSTPLVNGQTLTVEYHFDILTTGDYTGNFLKVLYSSYGSSSVQIQTTTFDTVGSQSINYANHAHWRADAGMDIDTWGLVVGSSTNTKNLATYKLYNQIQSGSGSGQLSHGAVQGDPIVITSPSSQFSLKRIFTNNSGGSINVSETGIYIHGTDLVGGNPVNTQDNKKTCIARSLFTTFSVGNGESFQIKYNARVTN